MKDNKLIKMDTKQLTNKIEAASGRREFFIKWEMLLLYIFIIFNLVIMFTTEYYLSLTGILNMTFIFAEKGMIALIMTFIIITGNVDLSVASTMALSSVSMAYLYQSGLNIWASVLIGLCIGTICGFINGIIITRIKISSIIVTLATFSLYRGIAYVIMKDKVVSSFPDKFDFIGQGYIGNSMIPFPLFIFVILLIIAGLILHKTVWGRMVYAIGLNNKAAHASGIPVNKMKIILFSISGLISSVAGIFVTSRIGSSRPYLATGFELEIITIVILGGVLLSGGIGNIFGVLISLFLIATVRYGLGLNNISGQIMLIVMGSLLILSILLHNILKNYLKKKASTIKEL